MRRQHFLGHRYCRRRACLDIARLFDDEPDADFVDRMVVLYREYFDGPSANAAHGPTIVGPNNG
jgi:hypothetical protein